MAHARCGRKLRAMNPEVFMWLALLAFALVAIVLVGWTIVHLAAPRGDDDLAPR